MYEKMNGQIHAWLEEGREKQKREKKKGSIPEVSEKVLKNQTSTPESSYKIVHPSTIHNVPRVVIL